MNENENKLIELPETYSRRELNALYRKIPLKDATFRMLRKYFNAMAHLYGRIPLRKAWEIIQEQNPKGLTEAEFYAFAEVARHECEGYYIMRDDELFADVGQTDMADWVITDIDLFVGKEDSVFGDLDRQQKDKEYYIPPKKELLLYSEEDYCEMTPQAQKLYDFLAREIGSGEEAAKNTFDGIVSRMRRGGCPMQRLVDLMEKNGVEFDGDTIQEFLEIYQEFNNNLRMQCNRGHTPGEMDSMTPENPVEKQEKLEEKFWSMNLPDEYLGLYVMQGLARAELAELAKKPPKIGRNDPCPCGSGKKYKKCCGR